MKTVAGTKQDPTIAFVDTTVDNVTYKLAFSFNAIAEAEAVTNCNLLSGMWKFLTDREGMNAQQLRGLLYASLQLAQPEITLEQAGDMITLDSFFMLQQAVNAAFIMSLPEKKRQEVIEAAQVIAEPTEN